MRKRSSKRSSSSASRPGQEPTTVPSACRARQTVKARAPLNTQSGWSTTSTTNTPWPSATARRTWSSWPASTNQSPCCKPGSPPTAPPAGPPSGPPAALAVGPAAGVPAGSPCPPACPGGRSTPASACWPLAALGPEPASAAWASGHPAWVRWATARTRRSTSWCSPSRACGLPAASSTSRSRAAVHSKSRSKMAGSATGSARMRSSTDSSAWASSTMWCSPTVAAIPFRLWAARNSS